MGGQRGRKGWGTEKVCLFSVPGRSRGNRSGFSLLEVLLVLLILGIMMGVGVYQLQRIQEMAYAVVERITGGPLFNGIFEAGGIHSSGEDPGGSMDTPYALEHLIRNPGYILIKPDTTYELTGYEEKAEWPRLYFYDANREFIRVEGFGKGKSPPDARYIRFRLTLKNPGEHPVGVRLEEEQELPLTAP